MSELQHLLNQQALMEWFKEYRMLGIVLAFLLPFIEAFLPFLPIIVFAVVNVNVFGFIPGFLLTWSGAVSGAYIVFIIVRTYGQSRFLKSLNHHPHVRKFIGQIDAHGIIPLFVLLCFPFTPSGIINVVAALSAVQKRHFLLAAAAGKAVMLLLLSYIGNDISSFVTQPKKSIIVLLLLLILWWLGRKVENYYHERAKQS